MKIKISMCFGFVFLISIVVGTYPATYASERLNCIEEIKNEFRELKNDPGQKYFLAQIIRDKATRCYLDLEKDTGIGTWELQILQRKGCMIHARQTVKGFEAPDHYDEDEEFGFALLMDILDGCGLFLRDVIENKSELEQFRQRMRNDEFIERLHPREVEAEKWRQILFE